MGRAVDQSFFGACAHEIALFKTHQISILHFCKRILQHVPSHSFLSFPQHTTFLPFLYMSIIVYHPPCDSNHGQNRPISTMFLPNFAKVQVGKTPGKTPELLPGQCPDPFPGARVARCRGPCHVRSRGACPEACPGACRATWAEAPREH